MDSLEVIIARLVLGYLKNEKCLSAYKEFFRTSHNLRDTGLSKSKYLPTRFVGLTLEDILSQYFEMYKIVQGRLEATNYYNERHSKNTLVEQLLYLLNCPKIHTSRTSTPCPRSPPESNFGDETSPNHIDPISDVETTPAHTLPGNIRSVSENSYLHKSARRKSHSKYCKSDSIAGIQVSNKDDMSEVLAQTLLENKEFHEKIAQTINKVAEKQCRVSGELDKTIRTVVRETEEDPIFDKILDEIIGSTAVIDANKGIESGSTSSSNVKNKSTSTHYDNRSKRVHKHSDSSESHDPSYMCTDSKKVEEQNNEAIQSIVANARLASNTQTDGQEMQSNNEVIVFDGSLDKYLISNTCNANTQTQPIQNPLYINATGSVLMVPSAIPTNVSGNIQIDASKQYYFVNKQPTIGWNMPTIKTQNVLTEQDILAMPTVIVNDDQQTKIVSTHSHIQNPVLNTVKTPSLKTLIPKPTIEIPAEYYQYNAPQPQQNYFKKIETEKEEEPSNAVSSNVTAKANTSGVRNNSKSLPSDLLEESQVKPLEEENEICQQTATQLTKSDPSVKTPLPPEPTQKVTPKSGSHVRNLDFSTPPKITSTQKKLIKSKGGKTPPFVHKKQTAKMLFKPRNKDLSDTDTTRKDTFETKTDIQKRKKRPAGDWDADLRASISNADTGDDQTPKKKKQKLTSNSAKPIKKKSKKANMQQRLNTTDQDGALLEAALQTPVKSNKELDDINAKNITEDQLKHKSVLSDRDNETNTCQKNNTSRKVTEVSNKKKYENSQHKREVTDNNASKMILSPSKLNANKRNILNTDLTSVDDNNKFVTPEMAKENFHHPITHAKNISLLLETPLKDNIIPKTPGPKTPMDPSIDQNLSFTCSIYTPLSKMLEENLKGIDINLLPTPSMPITPSFPPFTPTVDLLSPYSNRPTDYSTSSSYYQPSDSEQNKSLEANVIELEKKPLKIHSDVLITKEEILVSIENKVDDNIPKTNENESSHTIIVNKRLNVFNKNVIGKKNLNLMERDLSGDSSSEEVSSSDTSSEGHSDSFNNWGEKDSNDTVICSRKPVETPKRTYSLRNRTIDLNNQDLNKKVVDTKDVKSNKKQQTKNVKIKLEQHTNDASTKQANKPEEIKHKEEVEKKNAPNEDKSVTSNVAQLNVSKELEEKRLRTINKFKSIEKVVAKKVATKPSVRQIGKFMKIKPIPNITNTRRKPRKSDSPKKKVQKKTETVGIHSTSQKKQCDQNDRQLGIKENEDKDAARAPPVDKILDTAKNLEKSDKSSSDVEAQNLIEGLKERGIHLMHNKSPTKKTNELEPENELKPIDDNTKITTVDPVTDLTKNISESDISEEKGSSLSTSYIESEIRDVYDICEFSGETEQVIFDEAKPITRSSKPFDSSILRKRFLAKVYFEELDQEIELPLAITPFQTLLDIPSADIVIEVDEQLMNVDKDKGEEQVTHAETCNKTESTSCKETVFIRDISNVTTSDETQKSNDDLMNYAVTGREGTPEGSNSPKSTKKRKIRSEDVNAEKQCKTLLKKINVDSFLNNIHGGS